MAFIRVLCFALLVGLTAACQSCCQPASPAKCPPMWTHYKGHCYRYFANGKNYGDAEEHCREFTAVGLGHLASVANAEENDMLLAMWTSLSTSSVDRVWIGLNDKADEGTYVWTDGSTSTYTNWKHGEPNNGGGNEDCAHLRREGDGPWNDTECSREEPYICKMATTE